MFELKELKVLTQSLSDAFWPESIKLTTVNENVRDVCEQPNLK